MHNTSAQFLTLQLGAVAWWVSFFLILTVVVYLRMVTNGCWAFAYICHFCSSTPRKLASGSVCAQIISFPWNSRHCPDSELFASLKISDWAIQKQYWVRPSSRDVKIESEIIHCTQKYFCLQTIQSSGLKCFIIFLRIFFPSISTSSCDPSHWLRAQNAASALCCGPWERMGVGQGWHRQRDAGKVWSPSKHLRIYIQLCSSGQKQVPFTNDKTKLRVAHVHLHVIKDSCCPFRTECQCVGIDPWLQISDTQCQWQ